MNSKYEPGADGQIADLMQKLDLTDSAKALALIEAMIQPLCPTPEVFAEILTAVMNYGNLVAQEQTEVELLAAMGDEDAQRLCSLAESPVAAPFVPGDGAMH